MSSLLALPNEILEQIVVQCAYERSLVSISFLSQTCAALRNLIYDSSDTMLWKEVYLSMLDYPWSTRNIISKFLEMPTRNDFDWKGKFIAAMLLRKELKGSNPQLLENLDAHMKMLSELANIPLPVLPNTHLCTSSNAVWLDKLFINGFPEVLVHRLIGKSPTSISSDSDPPESQSLILSPEWEFNRGQRFYELFLKIGFRPYTPPNGLHADAHINPGKQRALARTVARHRVYNMLYPSRARCWGPYLPYESSSVDSNQPPEPHLLIPDYPFLSAARMVVETDLRESLQVDPDEMSLFWDSGQVWPLFTYEFARRDIYELVHRIDGKINVGDEASTRGLDALRMGSAPGFWGNKETREIWLRTSSDPENESSLIDGWDWAGVEGTWARAVCWMDYRELLYHSLSNIHPLSPPDQLNHNMRETCRISPMTFRITGYSRVSPRSSTLMSSNDDKNEDKLMDSLVYALPIIHFSDDKPGIKSNRTIRGTARMIGDGVVRWSLISRDNIEEQDDWALEAIQIGGIGSALGAVGMWTGVGHDRGDPLGPMWMWRVE